MITSLHKICPPVVRKGIFLYTIALIAHNKFGTCNDVTVRGEGGGPSIGPGFVSSTTTAVGLRGQQHTVHTYIQCRSVRSFVVVRSFVRSSTRGAERKANECPSVHNGPVRASGGQTEQNRVHVP